MDMDKKILMKKVFYLILIVLVLIPLFVPLHIASAACSPWDFGGCIDWALTNIANLILGLLSYLMGWAALWLNFVLDWTIVRMKTNLATLTGINTAWKVVRDLMNVFFIFLLIYEGIKLIINLNSRDGIKSFITGIVLASILINFSLFFTKVIIDTSNIVTIGFYQSILDTNRGKQASCDAQGNCGTGYGLADPIMGALHLTSAYDAKVTNSLGETSSFLISALGNALIILVAAFVFFAVSIVFAVRYMVLIILMMLSPVAYMGLGLPFMKKYASQWWTAFNSQILFAPIFMILTWINITLMYSPGFLTTGSFADAFDNKNPAGGGGFNLILNFAIIIGLLIASLIISKKTASQGNSLIGSAVGNATSFAGGALVGSTARFGRATVGRVGQALSEREGLKDASTKSGVRGFIARRTLSASNKAATSSFDARATDSFGKLASATGTNFGKVDASKQNFRKIREEQQKKAEEEAKKYKPSDTAYAEAKEKDELAKEELKERKEEAQKAADSAQKAYEAELNEGRTLDQIEKDLKAALEKEESHKKFGIPSDPALAAEINRLRAESETKKTTLASLDRNKKETKSAAEKLEKDEKEFKEQEERKLNEKYAERVNAEAGRKGHENRVALEAQRKLDADDRKSPAERMTVVERKKLEDQVKTGEHDTRTNKAWRYVANTVGLVTNVAGVTNMPMTKKDREALARKVRGVAKQKNSKDKLAEAVKDYQKDIDKESGEAAAETAAPAAAPAPTPAPAPEPPPSPPPAGGAS